MPHKLAIKYKVWARASMSNHLTLYSLFAISNLCMS
jgi:hypothetical protein